ncbi:glycosyl hydrolase family 18 protein [Enterococcus rivorum]|uniref:chitinase n=1 Tax=Enterococcus rivorum TaxID=762845 RepID=A0A1E5L1J2_9ENTE|nr:glycosyl hydrolase family 18 protein [Enterococcus rivorum]MBP2097745.1 GH18 family chitinase/chitodextrinase [Enterococcus rivorum]OEH84012.1 hypothetical protein BCR26_00645 [Enterococcus rivorum]
MKKVSIKRVRVATSLSMAAVMASSTFATAAMGIATLTPTEAHAEEPVSPKAEQVPYRNVMYYGDWSIWGGQNNFYPSNLDASLYTHLNYAFLAMDANGELILTDKDAAFGAPVGNADIGWDTALSGLIPAFTALKSKNRNLKVGISLGGWSKSANFSVIAANPEKRKNYIDNVLEFIKYTGMDFVDVDWEYPNSPRQPDKVDNKNDEGTPNATPADTDNFITLMSEFRTALDKQGAELDKYYELTCALPGTIGQLEKGIDVERLFEIIDFGNMMTYDMNGAFSEKSAHHTALYAHPDAPNDYSVETVVNYLRSKNVPANKIVIGAAMYTRGWNTVEKGDNPNLPGLFQKAALNSKDADHSPSRGASNELPLNLGDGGRAGGVWSYRNLDQLKRKVPDLKEYWDDVSKAPYLYSESTKQVYTFDNAKSIQHKTEYVKQNQLGGVISWMASNDKDSTGSGKRNELSTAIKKGLYGDQKVPETVTIDKSKLNVEFKAGKVKTDSGKDGYGINVTNRERLVSSNVALGAASRYYFTVKKPTFVITMKDGSTLERGDYKAGEVTAKDGKTYVNVATQYDSRFISPGAKIDFKLAAKNGAEVDPSKIEKVEMVQYFDKNTVLASQTILGNTTPEVSVPVISGVQDRTITVGDAFDPKAGVSASDKIDGDLTSKLSIVGNVETNKAGVYTLTYSVTNSSNKVATATRKITVKEKEKPTTPPTFSGISNKTINVGDAFDKMAGITAKDAAGKDITNKISVTGNVNTNQAGSYELTYSVTDDNGLKAEQKRTITVIKTETTPDFGVGKGIQWPNKVVAPYVDMVAYVSSGGNNGAPDLKKMFKESGTKFFNLGFMQAVEVKNGKLEWGWGGHRALSEAGNDKWQYEGIKKSIREIRAEGGDVTLSFGGLNSGAFWEKTQDVAILEKAYTEVVEGYGVTRIDLDVEAGAMDYNHNKANAKAIKRLQDKTGVEVTLTLPVMPSGLISSGLNVLKAYLEEGVDLKLVNIMTMVYGSSVPDYAQGSIEAVDNTMKQVKDHYKNYAKTTLTTEQAYAKIGTTPSVGFEGAAHPYFSKEMMTKVVDHARSKKIGMVSFWSMNRDAQIDNGQGQVKNKYEFSNVANKFIEDSTEPQPEKPSTPKDVAVGNITKDSANVTWEASQSTVGIKEYQLTVTGGGKTLTFTTDKTTQRISGLTAGTNYSVKVVAVDKKDQSSEAGEASFTTAKEIGKPSAVKELKVTDISNTTATIQWAAATSPIGIKKYQVSVKESGTTQAKESETVGTTIKLTSLKENTSYTVTVKAVDNENQVSTPVTVAFTTTKETGSTIPEWSATKIYVAKDRVMYKGKEYIANHWTQGNHPDQSGAYGPWRLANPELSEPSISEWSASKIYVAGDKVTYKGNQYKAKWWTKGNVPDAIGSPWQKL